MNSLARAENRFERSATRSEEQAGGDTHMPSAPIGATVAPDSFDTTATKANPATFDSKGTSIDPERERKRLEALKGIFGLWADRDDIPKDGVEYQRQLRAEWE